MDIIKTKYLYELQLIELQLQLIKVPRQYIELKLELI